MTPSLSTIAQIGLKHENFDPGPIDGIWGPKSAAAFARWEDAYFKKTTLAVPVWLAVARKEIGVSEISGAKHNPRILEYHARTSLGATDDETAWCASFACWCLEESGIASPHSAWARDFLKWGTACEPRVGAIVVLTRGAEGGHVGFLEKWDAKNLWLLGGNQSNTVNITSFPRTQLLGMRWAT